MTLEEFLVNRVAHHTSELEKARTALRMLQLRVSHDLEHSGEFTTGKQLAMRATEMMQIEGQIQSHEDMLRALDQQKTAMLGSEG